MPELMLFFKNKLVHNVKVHEPLGSGNHNQKKFNLKVKTRYTYNNIGEGTSTNANIKR